ncbi:MAG: alpha/beta fold hydrolase [Acidobacteria bacterium]|nr:alpha/beta fold hydrolase [Acidobacteriota bacterium]
MQRFLYLHGFASAPSSTKAEFFRRKLAEAGIELEVPALDCGDFENLTITAQLALVEQLAASDPMVLIGSSLGGYLASLHASRNPRVERLVLLAPAFYFPERWPGQVSDRMEEWKTAGSLRLYHYAEERERLLSYRFVEDALGYSAAPDFSQPALVFHGVRDDIVPVEDAREYALTHPNVRLVEVASGHELVEVLDCIWSESAGFLVHGPTIP